MTTITAPIYLSGGMLPITSVVGANRPPNVMTAPGTLAGNASVMISSEARTRDAAGKDDGSRNLDLGLRLHQQIVESGRDADLLAVMPDTEDAARIALAKQAVNSVLREYGVDAKWSDVSTENPFSKLSRKALSEIKYNDSGAYTPAERASASMEISNRDIDYWNRVSVKLRGVDQEKDAQAWRALYDNAWLQLYSGMSEAEQIYFSQAHGSEALLRGSVKLAAGRGVEVQSPPRYANLSDAPDTTLAAVASGKGEVSWQRINIAALHPRQDDVQRQTAVTIMTQAAQANRKAEQWVTLYLKVAGY
ncbi:MULTISPECIES: hypothetical protein [Cupriavidus]